MRSAGTIKVVAAAVAIALIAPPPLAAQSEAIGARAELLRAGVKQVCLNVHMARGLDRLAKAQRVPYDSMAVMALRNFRGQEVADSVIAAMFCGEVQPGMPQAMALAAWDRPATKVTRETEYGSGELWVYRDGRGLVILEGRVYSVTEAEGS